MSAPEGSFRTRGPNNNNMKGNNQYKDRPPPDDPQVAELLKKYHREGITDKKVLSQLFASEHGLTLSESTIVRRKKKLGLRASRLTTLELSYDVKRQLVLDQMAKDPKGLIGPRTVKQGIFKDTGVQLTRDWIIEEMRKIDPVGYAARGSKHVRARREQRLAEAGIPPSLSSGLTREPVLSSALSEPLTIIPTDMPTISIDRHAQSPRAPSLIHDTHFQDAVPSANPVTPEPLSPHSIDEDQDSDADTGGYPGQSDRTIPNEITRQVHPNPSSAPWESASEAGSLGPSSVHPSSSSLTVVLNALETATPNISGITQLLSQVNGSNGEFRDPKTYETIMRCLEAAALLERQLSRLASGSQSRR